MSNQILSLGLSIEPSSTSGLTVVPAATSLTLTVGAAAPSTPIATVKGGVPPYVLTPKVPLPAGLSFYDDKKGSIYLTGTPTVAVPTTEQILVTVSDSTAQPAQTVSAAVGTTSAPPLKKVWGQ
jgi:hypothetical protein